MISILIVDDHRLMRETLAMVLSRDKRFKIIGTCGDSDTAVEMSVKKRPDIVLMDIHLPPGSGMEATRQIRKKCPKTRVITLTMYNQAAYARKMLQLGASGYLTKNSSPQEMTMAIVEVSKGNDYICEEMMESMADKGAYRSAVARLGTLTERQTQVLNLLRKGLTSADISEKLAISLKTIEVHRYHILRKLQRRNMASLIYFLNAHIPM